MRALFRARLDAREILDIKSPVAPTVPEMSPDPELLDDGEMPSGKLMATRLALWEAIGRLDDVVCIELRDAFDEMLREIDTAWPEPLTLHQAEVVDELELITHQLRYYPARTPGAEPPSGEYAGVCMRCDTFPLDINKPCPNCHTRQFLSVLRI